MPTGTSQSQSKAEADRIAALNDHSRGKGKGIANKEKKPKPSTSSLEAAVKVLTKAKGPMHNRDLADALPGDVNYSSFYALLKAHPETFIKTRPAVFDLKERNPKGADLPQRTATGKEVKVEPKGEAKAKAATPAKAKKKSPAKAAAKSTPKTGSDGKPATTGEQTFEPPENASEAEEDGEALSDAEHEEEEEVLAEDAE